MRFDPDGRPFVAGAAGPAVIALLTGRRRAALGLAVLPVAVGLFFRDPDRRPDRGPSFDADEVVAPADGKVMHAGSPMPGTEPDRAMGDGGAWQQVSIFLSVADVHINRSPYGGTVAEVRHRPGRYLAAFRAEAADQNERSEIVVTRRLEDGDERTVVFRQIVGVLARRVVTRVRPGDILATGDRIGLMRFGSRMDVFVPADVALSVEAGDRVVAGETVIARWRR